MKLPENAAPTRPYFSRPSEELPYYDKVDERYRDDSFAPYPLAAWIDFTYLGVPVRIGQVVQTVQQQSGQGMVLNPLVVTPAVSVRIFPRSRYHAAGLEIVRALRASAHRSGSGRKRHGAARSSRRLALRACLAPFALDRAGQEQIVRFRGDR